MYTLSWAFFSIILGSFLPLLGKGASGSPVAEFNFHSDPEAADVVLRETECPVTVVPFETCYATPLPHVSVAIVKALFNACLHNATLLTFESLLLGCVKYFKSWP